jgi:hypothetical protein
MAPAGSKRARYGTKNFIKQVLANPDSKNGLKTSELVSKVQAIAGKKIPGATVFQAAKSLVKEKVLGSKRDGREFRFMLAGSANVPPEPPAATPIIAKLTGPRETPSEPRPVGASLTSSELAIGGAVTPSGLAASPHKLDPGQVLVLRSDEKTIVTLTNVHGRPIVERHPVPG